MKFYAIAFAVAALASFATPSVADVVLKEKGSTVRVDDGKANDASSDRASGTGRNSGH